LLLPGPAGIAEDRFLFALAPVPGPSDDRLASPERSIDFGLEHAQNPQGHRVDAICFHDARTSVRGELHLRTLADANLGEGGG
jgi:hypothetical protein